MESLNQRKRKSKGKWFMNAKKAKYAICPGQKGFLVFCNKFEREAIKEARVLFDEYEPKFVDKAIDENEEIEISDNGDESPDEFDAAEAEQKELKETKQDDKEKFKLLNTGVQNVLYFKTRLNDSLKFSMQIMDDILASKEQKTRYLMRLVPVQATCKAHESNVKEALQKLLKSQLQGTSKSFCVVFKARCNQEFKKETVISIVSDLMKEFCPNSKVEYKKPDIVVMVELMKSNCCLALLPDYFGKYRKYNLIELSKEKVEKAKEAEDNGKNVNDEVIKTEEKSSDEKKSSNEQGASNEQEAPNDSETVNKNEANSETSASNENEANSETCALDESKATNEIKGDETTT